MKRKFGISGICNVSERILDLDSDRRITIYNPLQKNIQYNILQPYLAWALLRLLAITLIKIQTTAHNGICVRTEPKKKMNHVRS